MMVGMRNIMPTSRNTWFSGGESAPQCVIDGGTIWGHRMIASPRHEIRNSAIDHTNGGTSRRSVTARQNRWTMKAVTSGTGDSSTMLGQENQRAAMPDWV